MSNFYRRILFLALVLSLTAFSVSAQPKFTFEGTYTFLSNSPPNNAVVLTPDQKIAVTLTFLTSSFSGKLTSFDPVTGTVFDSETVNFMPWDVELVRLNDGIRVGVLGPGGENAAIYDMSESGQLTLRFPPLVLSNRGVDGRQNLFIERAGPLGFRPLDKCPVCQRICFF